MGGKALKILGIETERKSTQEHLRIEQELIPIISDMFNTEVRTVKFYRNKKDHGDCDLLIHNHGNLGNIRKKLEERFGPVYSNGSVYSFEYDKYQIDIIPQPSRNWGETLEFFSYDPSGNLSGKLAHKLGLKYGFSGLVYPFRTFSGRLTTDIVISTDQRKIHDFLDLDYDRYLEGFDEVEDIFDFITNSKYFNSDSYDMDNLTHKDRKRNQKRKTYQEFLDYIEKNKGKLNNYQFDKNKENYIDMIDEFFPEANFKSQLEKLKEKDRENHLISLRFNGNIIMEMFPELKGKELGNIINKYKEFHGEEYRNFIINNNQDEIKQHFKNWYSKLNS